MALFNAEERSDVLQYITAITERNEHVAALIAVGSSAYGYVDGLSDLDFVVAIDSWENLDAVRNYVAEELRKRASFIYFKQAAHIPLQVFLCDNYLEIDIGYGVYTDAAATREHWRVLFDKTGTVDEAMRSSWDRAKDRPKEDGYPKKHAECADRAWHNLMHCAVAIKRGQCWRAAAELDAARNYLAELLCLRYSLDAERGRDMDKLPETELSALKKTLVAELSPQALWSSLTCLTDAIYTELERDAERARITVNRRQVTEYIDACRELAR